ncbi:MAG: hypothetical protein LLG04_17110, partial [Parachlamydia sp.]|nr:hypothetical protein [Parachlamydia sp.]
ELQKDERLLNKIPAIPPRLLQYVTEKRAIDRLSPSQLEEFGSIGFNQLANLHHLWKRITRHALADLAPQKVLNVAKSQLKEIRRPSALRAIKTWDLVHLTKQQLIVRKQFGLSYGIGVLTLGVAACLISLFAAILLPGVSLINKKACRKYRAIIKPHIWRVGHLFHTYLPAAHAV